VNGSITPHIRVCYYVRTRKRHPAVALPPVDPGRDPVEQVLAGGVEHTSRGRLSALSASTAAVSSIRSVLSHLPICQRQQRQLLTKLITCAPKQLTTETARASTGCADQEGLADPRLAFDQHGPAPTGSYLADPRSQPRQLRVTTQQRSGRAGWYT
jgi:hypothetical protein